MSCYSKIKCIFAPIWDRIVLINYKVTLYYSLLIIIYV